MFNLSKLWGSLQVCPLFCRLSSIFYRTPIFKFEDLMADLAAYLVSEYDIEPRDAAGLVMNSPQTQALYSSEEPITEQRVKALAGELLKEGKK